LETTAEPGSGPNGGVLTCFEEKSWPGYQGFRLLTKDNVHSLQKETQKFIEYIDLPGESWVVQLPGGVDEPRRPDRFGFLVFDYAEEDREAILTAFNAAHPDLQELESITRLLAMILYNGGLKDEAFSQELRDGQAAMQRLATLFLPEG
jgi:hypothetical protein